MKAVVRWQGEVCFEAESETGHKVLMDGPPDHGGQNRGARPMEMILMGVGGCASFDVVHILKKARQDVTDCRCEMDAERAQDQVPAVFTRVQMHFVVRGRSLKEAQVKRAVELSAEKYCSGSIMLSRAGVIIEHSFSVEQEDA
ncbi:MAG: OsmC family protein [Alcanivoracaceae bacterium]|jgi:putative redox protein|nr:OsmC family protein [Alcanivoracaceae bacterium]